VSGGADGVVKGWDTRVSDRCAFEISLRDALSGRENASKMRVYSVAADDVSVFVGGFAGSIFAFDARKLPSLDDRVSTSSSVRDAMTTIPNAPSRRHGGALRAPVAGLARARLDARNDALFSTAAYFDVSRESTLDADFDEKARGCVRVFSVPKNDADVTETCALPNFGGGLVTCLGVRDFTDKDKDEGVAIVAGDVDGGVSAWRSIAGDPSDAEDEETDRDALSAEGFSFPSETNAEANAEPEPLTETSSTASRRVLFVGTPSAFAGCVSGSRGTTRTPPKTTRRGRGTGTTRDGFGIDREKPLEKKNRIWTVGFCRCCLV
jgi:hypothetical protein